MAYYILFWQSVLARPAKCGVSRSILIQFEEELSANRELAQLDDPAAATKVDFGLLEYDRLNQSPNDASAIEFRVTILTAYIEAGKSTKATKK